MRLRRVLSKLVRRSVASLPRPVRFAIYRSLVDCDPRPSDRLVLKIAETSEELSACFSLLHDAYVESGFMKPDPSGMRVTIYHALPTTTTLCAKWDGEVVGTISLIREGPFGFPMQQIFDLTSVRLLGGSLAEVSALAVHARFRNTGGAILFPLMKFMYEYCRKYFDTRHLLIAVNPNRIEMYESLLGFTRLTANVVESYDFANGAPAVGAALDLETVLEALKRLYANRVPRKNLYTYFAELQLTNLRFPNRRYFTTNDPVLTPSLLNEFFNVRTQGFALLDDRKKALLHAVYRLERFQAVLPSVPSVGAAVLRGFPRFSVKCPAELRLSDGDRYLGVTIVDVSVSGFKACFPKALPVGSVVMAKVQVGQDERARIQAIAVREDTHGLVVCYGFKVEKLDLVWRKFVQALEHADTYDELDRATVFL